MKNFIYSMIGCLILATCIIVSFGIRTSDVRLTIIGFGAGLLALALHVANTAYERRKSRHLLKSY